MNVSRGNKRSGGSGYMKISEAAKTLGITRQALYERIKKGADGILDYLVKDSRIGPDGKELTRLYIRSEYVERELRRADALSPATVYDFMNAYYDLWECIEEYLKRLGIIEERNGKLSEHDVDLIENVIIGETIRVGELGKTESKIFSVAIRTAMHHSEEMARKNIEIFSKILEECRFNLLRPNVSGAGTPEQDGESPGDME